MANLRSFIRLSCVQRSSFNSTVIRSRTVCRLLSQSAPIKYTSSPFVDLDSAKKPTRRFKPVTEAAASLKPGQRNVIAYATCDYFDLNKLREGLISQGVYIPQELPSTESPSPNVSPDYIYAEPKYRVGEEDDRCMFYFHEGTVVMWNFTDIERASVLKFLTPYEFQRYPFSVVLEESENMCYSLTPSSKKSYISEGVIHIAADSHQKSNIILDMYTFANCMSLSVKLGIFESSLEDFVHGTNFLTEDLKHGKKIRINRRDILKKSGELFALRHAINLSTDLLDTPDFYWDRDNLEVLYQQSCSYFSIGRRTKVLNEKLNHCIDLIGLISSHLSDRHHIRLEWMIIVLIMVEVAFEFVHIMKR